MVEEPGEDDERSIWLPPEELERVQRERNREMRAMLDKLADPLSKEKRG
jgi:hypothetical protein